MTTTNENKLTERDLQHYVIALFDVLGFSDLHKNLGTEKLYQIYEELIDKAIIEKTKDGIKFLGTSREGIFIIGNLEIRYVYFSDTIILWTTYREEFFRFLLQFVRSLWLMQSQLAYPLEEQ